MNDHYIIPLFVAGTLLLALFAFFLVTYLVVVRNKRNAYMLEKRQMVFDHESNILKAKIEEQESTMDQISKELHDNVKSVLGFAQMSISRISDLATSDEQVKLIEKTNFLIGQVIDDLHNISHSLNSNFVRHIGLIDTLTKELEHIKNSKSITYSFEIMGEPYSLSPEKELHIYRIAQEAMQNCVKHAKATNLNFILTFDPGLFMMQLTDNGVGFAKEKIYDMKGLGFLNMFQRARYVDGTLDIQSTPFEGSSVTLTLNPGDNGRNN